MKLKTLSAAVAAREAIRENGERCKPEQSECEPPAVTGMQNEEE